MLTNESLNGQRYLGLSVKSLLIILFFVSFIARGSYSYFSGKLFAAPNIHTDAIPYDHLAYNMSRGKGFGKQWVQDFKDRYEPYNANGDYDFVVKHEQEPELVQRTYRVPLYPAFLVAAYSFLGDEFYRARLLQCLLCSLIIFPIFELGRRLYSVRVGVIGAVLAGLNPMFILYSSELITEALSALLIVIVVLSLFNAVSAKSLLYIFLSGLMMGITILTKPAVTLWTFFICFWLGFYLWRDKKRLISNIVMFLCGIAIVCLPWIVRNSLITKQLTFITTQGGFAFLIGHNPDCLKMTGGHNKIDPEYRIDPDGLSATEFNKQCMQSGLRYVKGNFSKLPKLYFLKAFMLWNPFSRKILGDGKLNAHDIARLIQALLYPFFAIGLWKMHKDKEWLLFYFIFIAHTVTIMLTLGAYRYIISLIPFILLFVSVGFDLILSKFSRHVNA